jgi:acyl carrier protein
MESEKSGTPLSIEEIERSLQTIWREVLPQTSEEILTNAPFIEIGGDSISAMVCITRMRSMFGIEFDMVDFFLDDSSISYFARSIWSINGKP